MKIERLTVGQLIELLQQYPDDLPVVVQSYEDGYDPVTDAEIMTITLMQNREWYVGIYDKAEDSGESALLILSKYNRAGLE